MFPLASTFNDLHENAPSESSGPVASLVASVQSAAPRGAMPEAPAAGPAANMQAAAGAVEHAALAQQHLAAQQQASEHLAALKGAAHGSGLRVQVVGGQTPQW